MEDSDDLPLTVLLVALSGISCRERVEVWRIVMTYVPLSGSPGGFVRYIIPGKGPLVDDSYSMDYL